MSQIQMEDDDQSITAAKPEAPEVNFKKTAAVETQYGTGAQRDNRQGKGALHWVPWDAMFLVSRIYELGNKGRSSYLNGEKVEVGKGDGHDRNWEHGMPILDLCQSAMNHLTAYIAGDRSEAHLPMAAWNCINAIAMSIWVYMGWRPASLNRTINQRGPYNVEPICPLSPMEIEWLKVRGIEKKDASGNTPNS